MTIHETLATPVDESCDVLVCGGGIAGIAAALSAARAGKDVLLLEKSYLLGGLATAGLITYYLPLCDGFGRQVSFGIAEELLRLSVSEGNEGGYPDNWLNSDDPTKRTEHDPRFETRYNPQLFALLAERLLLQNGVRILYGTYAVGVHKVGDTVDTVLVENKSGRSGIAVKTVIDATGDCDIARFAEAPTALFEQGNVLPAWYYAADRDGYHLNVVGFADIPEDRKTEADRERQKDWKRYGGVDGAELSQMMLDSHALTLKDYFQKRERDNTTVIATLATTPQVRMTRKLVGAYTLHDTEMHTLFDDSVGMVSDWRERGPVYEVPYRTLYTEALKNLLVCGRCTSVSDSMWDIMRVIPCCAVTGEAVGLAAALTDDVRTLDLSQLQTALRDRGVVLHESEL